MTLGNILSNQEKENQYSAKWDESVRCFRILDLYSSDIKLMTGDDTVSDDSPAVTIISDGMWQALLTEATAQGRIPNLSNQNIDIQEFEDELENAYQQIENLTEELKKSDKKSTDIENKSQHSEGFDFNIKAMDSILKLAGIQNVSELNKE